MRTFAVVSASGSSGGLTGPAHQPPTSSTVRVRVSPIHFIVHPTRNTSIHGSCLTSTASALQRASPFHHHHRPLALGGSALHVNDGEPVAAQRTGSASGSAGSSTRLLHIPQRTPSEYMRGAEQCGQFIVCIVSAGYAEPVGELGSLGEWRGVSSLIRASQRTESALIV